MTSPNDKDSVSSETAEVQAEPKSPSEPGQPDSLDKLSRTITFVGTAIGVVVTATALLSSCDASKAQRFKSFREAVASEETYWKELYSDYQGVFTKDFDDRRPARRARILAIYTLAQRRPATFAEFSVPDSERDQASQLIKTMKTSLLNALQDTDPELADELRRRAFLTRPSEQPATPTQDSPPTPDPPEQRVTPPPVAPTTGIVELSPPHDSGWDVDLFWCSGANRNANYQTASTIGSGFASLAVSGRTIAPGVALGRVRILPAPAALQRPPGPAIGFTVVHDIGAGEAEAGRAILDTINGSLVAGVPRFRLLRSYGRPTRWLISAFVCARSPSPTTAANAAGRAAMPTRRPSRR